MARIIVNISPGGQVHHEVEGAVGTACERITQPYLDAFGLRLDEIPVQLKSEYHQTEQVHDTIG